MPKLKLMRLLLHDFPSFQLVGIDCLTGITRRLHLEADWEDEGETDPEEAQTEEEVLSSDDESLSASSQN